VAYNGSFLLYFVGGGAIFTEQMFLRMGVASTPTQIALVFWSVTPPQCRFKLASESATLTNCQIELAIGYSTPEKCQIELAFSCDNAV
jgi:hypothetical protein